MRRSAPSATTRGAFWRDLGHGDTLPSDGFTALGGSRFGRPDPGGDLARPRRHLPLQAKGRDAPLHEHPRARSRMPARRSRQQEVEGEYRGEKGACEYVEDERLAE
jgi:hypothetical protein